MTYNIRTPRGLELYDNAIHAAARSGALQADTDSDPNRYLDLQDRFTGLAREIAMQESWDVDDHSELLWTLFRLQDSSEERHLAVGQECSDCDSGLQHLTWD